MDMIIPMDKNPIYRVIFVANGKQYELFAREVSQGALFGFVEIAGLLFGERSSVVVDPAEEKLKSEFAGVKRFHVPMHAVIRIDEMEREGTSKVSDLSDKGNVAAFPPIYTPPKGS